MADRAQPPVTGMPSLLALGFRPFFLAAALWAGLGMLLWVGILAGKVPAPAHYGPTAWHAHELLFGYVGAVIAGFLLTAVRNWTGIDTPTGWSLGALALLWLAGRMAPFLALPDTLIALVDLAFFPALAAALWRPIWRGRNRVNRVFLVLLAAMTLASALVHAQALGLIQGGATRGNRLMLDLILLTLLLVAGRVMPFFTERAVAGAKPIVRPWVERLTFVLAAALLGANLAAPGSLGSLGSGAIALGLGAVQAVRLAGWHHPGAWRIPILAVLHAGYLWLIAGYLLGGLAGLGLLPAFPALHALTAGAIAVMTLGMMARVTLGHTGREMRSSALTNLAFVLVNAAALTRVVTPLVLPAAYGATLMVSGALWILAFGLFLWVHAPMLVRPRVDGHPG